MQDEPVRGRLPLPARFDGGGRRRTLRKLPARDWLATGREQVETSNRREVGHRRKVAGGRRRAARRGPAAKTERERRIIEVRPAPTILAERCPRTLALAPRVRLATIDTLRQCSDNDNVASKWSCDNQLRCLRHRSASRRPFSPRLASLGLGLCNIFAPNSTRRFSPQRAPVDEQSPRRR